MSLTMSDFRNPNRRAAAREADAASDYRAGGSPLTGRRVLAIFLGFFLLVFSVNGLLIYKALKTFSGEVVAHPYERGLAYNRDIAQAREQILRDWKVEAYVAPLASGETEIRVTVLDGAGAAVSGVEWSAVLAAPADLARDVRVKLEATAPGRYAGKAAIPAGQRDLVLTASRGGEEVFRSRSRIDVQ
jgi:nitrogen fixation protein FixH